MSSLNQGFPVRAATILACLLAPSVLFAQKPSRATVPRPGQELRLERDDGSKLSGEIISISPDSVVVQSTGAVFRLGPTELASARVRTGTQPATSRGMGFGALIGGGIGLALGAIAEGNDDCGDGCAYEGLAASAGIALGVVGGALIGGLLGSLGNAPQWARVAPPRTGAASVAWDLHAGDGVRIAGHSRSTGVVVGGSGDSILVRLDDGVVRSVPTSSLERYIGERRGMGKGTLIGGVVGLGLSVVSYAADDTASPTTLEMAGGVTLMTAIGALIGGRLSRRSVWARIDQGARSQLSIVPMMAPGQVGMRARLEF